MKYAVLVLLILLFGCLQQADSDGVTRLNISKESNVSGQSGMPVSEGQNESGSEVVGEGSGTQPAETPEVPESMAPNPNWGTECEDAYDCQPSDMRNLCIMGKCELAECIFRDDCKEKDHCFNGKCYLESELYAEFPECGVNVGCNITCAGCESGKRRCMVTGWGSGNESKDYYVCTECNRDYDCLEGYSCVQHYCVRGA